jgi:acetoacetate decarboxylase
MSKRNLFNMPVQSGIQAYPEGPYYSNNREYLIISYETDMDLLRKVVPEPLKVTDPIVKFEFIRMPAYGLGDFTESGQVIPVEFKGEKGGYIHAMVLDGPTSVAGGREIWGFPKRIAQPKLYVDQDALVGTLDYGTLRIAQASMGLKQIPVPLAQIKKAVQAPAFVIKAIPDVDGTPKICQLVKFKFSKVDVKEAWTGPAALNLFHHALVPMAELPVKRIISAVHFVVDIVLPYGEVAHDYLAKNNKRKK